MVKLEWLNRNASALPGRRQERLAHGRINQIGDQCPKAYICKEMIGHVNAVITIDQHIKTGGEKTKEIISVASVSFLVPGIFPLYPECATRYLSF